MPLVSHHEFGTYILCLFSSTNHRVVISLGEPSTIQAPHSQHWPKGLRVLIDVCMVESPFTTCGEGEASVPLDRGRLIRAPFSGQRTLVHPLLPAGQEGEPHVGAGGGRGCADDAPARAAASPNGGSHVLGDRRAGAVGRGKKLPSRVLVLHLTCGGAAGAGRRGHQDPRIGVTDQGGRPPPPREGGCFDRAVVSVSGDHHLKTIGTTHLCGPDRIVGRRSEDNAGRNLQ